MSKAPSRCLLLSGVVLCFKLSGDLHMTLVRGSPKTHTVQRFEYAAPKMPQGSLDPN